MLFFKKVGLVSFLFLLSLPVLSQERWVDCFQALKKVDVGSSVKICLSHTGDNKYELEFYTLKEKDPEDKSVGTREYKLQRTYKNMNNQSEGSGYLFSPSVGGRIQIYGDGSIKINTRLEFKPEDVDGYYQDNYVVYRLYP